MRELLFRGFTPDENGKDKAFVNGEWIKGQWVQGSYLELNKTTYCFKEDYERDPGNTEHYIVFDQMTDWGLPNRHLQADVLPETVGQYTSLIDKNGKKIFEGDIVKADDYIFSIKYGKCGGMENADNYGYMGFYLEAVSEGTKLCAKYGLRDDICYFTNIVVIGNIHDNPELLTEAKTT